MSQWRVCEHILFPAFNLGFYVRVLVFIIKEIPPGLWCHFQLERVSYLFAGKETNIFVLRFARKTNIYTGAMDKQLLAKKNENLKGNINECNGYSFWMMSWGVKTLEWWFSRTTVKSDNPFSSRYMYNEFSRMRSGKGT